MTHSIGTAFLRGPPHLKSLSPFVPSPLGPNVPGASLPTNPHQLPRVSATHSPLVPSVTNVHAVSPTYATFAGPTISLPHAPSLPLGGLPFQKLPTPIRAHKLAVYLKTYNPLLAHRLCRGFTQGFPIHCTAPSSPSVPTNHPSALHQPLVVDRKLAKEISAGRIRGPYSTPPIHNLICSPLGLVPKKVPNEFRLIHNLSFPQGASVNDGISSEYSAVSYQDLDHCVAIIQSLGPGTLVAKADLESAFRLLPIHPDYFSLLGSTWRGSFYVDTCLPMGLSESCHHFETFSSALQWILTNHFNVPTMSHILDDFIFFGPLDSNICSLSLKKFIILTQDLNIPVKQSKAVPPTTTVELNGIEVDTISTAWRGAFSQISYPRHFKSYRLSNIDAMSPCANSSLP
jgi:hypothetical protein